MIYFVQCKQFVKIGCTDNLDRRLKELQAANPYELKLLHTMEGSYDTEAALHYIFKNERVNGEWFHYDLKRGHYLKWCLMAVRSDSRNPYSGANIKEFQKAGLHLYLRNKSKRSQKLRKDINKIRDACAR